LGRFPKIAIEVFDMARRKRNGKFAWRSKRANHGKAPARGKSRGWGKKAK